MSKEFQYSMAYLQQRPLITSDNESVMWMCSIPDGYKVIETKSLGKNIVAMNASIS